MIVRIEQKGTVTFRKAIKDFVKGYADFQGRTTRAGYWWVMLGLTILSAIMFYLSKPMFSLSSPMSFIFSPITIFDLVVFIPKLAISVRRYRDVGLTGWGILCLFFLKIIFFISSNSNFINEDFTNKCVFPVTIINTLIILFPIFPTDMLTISSKNRILRFFFRPENQE